MALIEPGPIGIVIGSIKINAMENTASFSVGDIFYQTMDSQVKNNIIVGQTFGDLDAYNMQPIASPIYDPDGIDTAMPMIMSPLGLED